MRKEIERRLMKAESLQSLKNSPGWKIIEDYLRGKEIRLINQLRRCSKLRMDNTRGRLDELEDFMRHLDMSILDGAEALKELRNLEKNMRESQNI